MQHNHVLKKLRRREEGIWELQAKYLISFCSIPDSLYFDMQRDYVLKKLCGLLLYEDVSVIQPNKCSKLNTFLYIAVVKALLTLREKFR